MTKKLYFLPLIFFILSAPIVACKTQNNAAPITPEGEIEYVPRPTPADNLPDLIANLSSNDPAVRIVSAGEIPKYGEDAAAAVPALTKNLYEDSSEVRRSMAIALGIIGANAQAAVPDLVVVLQTDDSYNVRVVAAHALGRIDNPSAVPVLANVLYQDDSPFFGLAVACAEAIGNITGERFTDIGGPGYTLNEEGVPLIVIEASAWWNTIGQYQSWESP